MRTRSVASVLFVWWSLAVVASGAAETLPVDDRPAWIVQHDIAIRAMERGDAATAREHLLDALAFADGAGVPAEFFERCMASLGTVQLRRGDYGGAEYHLRAAYIVREARLGPWALETGALLSTLADACGGAGKPQVAETMARRVVEIRSRALGTDHSETREARARLDGFSAPVAMPSSTVRANEGATLDAPLPTPEVDLVIAPTPWTPDLAVDSGFVTNVIQSLQACDRLTPAVQDAILLALAAPVGDPVAARIVALQLCYGCATDLAIDVLTLVPDPSGVNPRIAFFLDGAITEELARTGTARPCDVDLFVAVLHAMDGRDAASRDAFRRAVLGGADGDLLAIAGTMVPGVE